MLDPMGDRRACLRRARLEFDDDESPGTPFAFLATGGTSLRAAAASRGRARTVPMCIEPKTFL